MRSPPELGGILRTLIKGHEVPGNRRRGVGRRFYSGGGAIPNPRNCVGVLLVTDALASVLQALHDHRGRGRADDRNVRPDGSKQSHVVEVRVRNDDGIGRESQGFRRMKVRGKEIRAICIAEGWNQACMPQVVQAATSSRLKKLTEQASKGAEV